jgi:hypothetical protein
MAIISHRVLRYAHFGIAACAFVAPLAAQQSPLAQPAVGQIVNEVLRNLVPPSDSLSRIPLAKRQVILDYARTMTAFGYAGTKVSPAAVGVQAVATGSPALLNDCDEWGTKTCRQLGWGAYVWIEPISIASTTAVVRAYVSWADRGKAPFVPGVAPTGKATLASFAAEIHLSRSVTGEWKFARRGTTIVGD